jgi:hypothetical protein
VVVEQLVTDVLHLNLTHVLLVDAFIPHDAVLSDHVHGILAISIVDPLILENEEVYDVLAHTMLEGSTLLLELLFVDEAPLIIRALVHHPVDQDLVILSHESGKNKVLTHRKLLDSVQVWLPVDFYLVHDGRITSTHGRLKDTAACQRVL